ncbi:MAG: hypothetical protein HQL72_09880 [Magnetococcales bacterium]|nr:hypothetical protein [Magnetococcales bacterium]
MTRLIEWIKQAQGFHQATYPCKNYNLSAMLVEETILEGRVEKKQMAALGSVTVEEDAGGRLTFLFGSQRAFWAGVEGKLAPLSLSGEELDYVSALLAEKIPRPA